MKLTQSDVGAIETLALKHVRAAFSSDASVERQWQDLNYAGKPDYEKAIAEYERFAELLGSFGIEILYLPDDDAVGLDSIYVRDASIVCDKGLILCNMGKPARSGEPGAQKSHLQDRGVPVAGCIGGSGTLEGGDAVWIDGRTIAVGRGYRTNDEGIRQLSALLDDCIDEMLVVPLPHWRGPADVFHLMSVLSPIDSDLALVYSPLLPVPFREDLLSRGIRLVEVPDVEFETMGCNVLTVAPRRCVMLRGNPETRRRLEAADVEVHEYEGTQISVKGAGGPTCLTRPLTRATD